MNEIFLRLDRLGAETGPALDRFLNKEELYLKYIRDFPDEPTMPTLAAAMERRDYAAAQDAAHALKGITANLGLTPLTDATVDLHAELKDGNFSTAAKEYQTVRRQYNRFCELILAWRAGE